MTDEDAIMEEAINDEIREQVDRETGCEHRLVATLYVLVRVDGHTDDDIGDLEKEVKEKLKDADFDVDDLSVWVDDVDVTWDDCE